MQTHEVTAGTSSRSLLSIRGSLAPLVMTLCKEGLRSHAGVVDQIWITGVYYYYYYYYYYY